MFKTASTAIFRLTTVVLNFTTASLSLNPGPTKRVVFEERVPGYREESTYTRACFSDLHVR